MECDIFIEDTKVGTAYCYDDGEENYYGTFYVDGYTFHTPYELAGYLHIDPSDLSFKEVIAT